MTIVPVLLDARPAYLGHECAASSQLLCPVGGATLISELYTSVRDVTGYAPSVLPSFTPDSTYLPRLRHQCPAIESVLDAEEFLALLGGLVPSDVLLLVSPAHVPAAGLDLRELVGSGNLTSGLMRHLLAFDATTLRTKELVQTDTDGRVRRIQRYFEPVTWPFPVGVIASMVPLASFQLTGSIPLDSLMALRQTLTLRGLPSQDIPFHGDVFDLTDERGALALNEMRLRTGAPASVGRGGRPRSSPPSGAPAVVHPSARVLGTVAMHAGVVIEANALVVGPSVIGDGARVREGAVVAQCVVLPGAVIPPDATVRHRVVVDRAARQNDQAGAAQRRHSSVGQRFTAAPQRQLLNPTYLDVKYAAEPIFAAILLLILSPLLLLFGILVRATSAGPIFYGDSREGKDGKSFLCWKFRTMVTGADDMQRSLKSQQSMDGPQFKMERDPRVTRVGRWLRMLNVDELPQLWNVLRGEMSFVGPRPSPFRENQICVPWRHGRLSVRPGITGLWQVCRHNRNLGDFHQWVHYDMLYVRNVSLLVDLKILFYTLVTLGGRRSVLLSDVIGDEASQHEVSPLAGVRVAPVVIPIRSSVPSIAQGAAKRYATTGGEMKALSG